MTNQVLRWLRWFADCEFDKMNEAIADNNKQLADDLSNEYKKICAVIEKEEERKRIKKLFKNVTYK